MTPEEYQYWLDQFGENEESDTDFEFSAADIDWLYSIGVLLD